MNCYCCSGNAFKACCQPFIERLAKPQTAEALMRSRYAAYATVAIDYILETTHRTTRNLYDPKSIAQWATSSIWLKLEVLSTQAGGINDSRGKVEFKAYYQDSGRQFQVHHEHSNFVKENGEWFFVDGLVK